MKRLLRILSAFALLLIASGTVVTPARAEVLGGPQRAPFDERAFLQEMIMHHQMAVMMAQMVRDRVPHAETRALAGNIITSQAAEMMQMRRWLREWYGVEAPAMMPMDMMHMEMMEMMAGLSGPRLEVMFLIMMVQHHTDAITMAQMALTEAPHAETRTLALNIIVSQLTEVLQMNTWLRDWYGL